MADKHISTQFDADLNAVSSHLMQMAGMVEAQTRDAVDALNRFNVESADRAIFADKAVNAMELQIDQELISVICRRQPTARDLRLLMAISRITANLERAGDEAGRIARMVKSIIEAGMTRNLPSSDLHLAVELATDLLRKSLDAFARQDVQAAIKILRDDDAVDREFGGFMRKLITFMMEDPRTISGCLDLVFVAKAVERIGDHAKNIAESVIYIVEGEDVRHVSLEQIETTLKT